MPVLPSWPHKVSTCVMTRNRKSIIVKVLDNAVEFDKRIIKHYLLLPNVIYINILRKLLAFLIIFEQNLVVLWI